MSEVIIRDATKADAGMIADISRSTFYQTFAPYNTPEDIDKFMVEQFSREKLIAQVGAPGNIFFMAYLNNEMLGYVRMVEGPNPEGLGKLRAIEIARIYAVSNAIGKGVGSKLMQEAIDIAFKKKKEAIWLGVWEKNQRAIEFYTKWGFEKFGVHDFVLGNDVQTDWLMMRKV